MSERLCAGASSFIFTAPSYIVLTDESNAYIVLINSNKPHTVKMNHGGGSHGGNSTECKVSVW